jgi:hypothetical protein
VTFAVAEPALAVSPANTGTVSDENASSHVVKTSDERSTRATLGSDWLTEVMTGQSLGLNKDDRPWSRVNLGADSGPIVVATVSKKRNHR